MDRSSLCVSVCIRQVPAAKQAQPTTETLDCVQPLVPQCLHSSAMLAQHLISARNFLCNFDYTIIAGWQVAHDVAQARAHNRRRC